MIPSDVKMTQIAVPGPQEEMPAPVSWQRTLGASFFGLVSATYVLNAASRTIPRAIAMGQGIDLQSAVAYYEDSALIRFSVLLITALAGGVTAGFLGRQRGMLVGLLANFPYLCLLAYMSVVSTLGGISARVAQLPMAMDLQGDTTYILGIVLRFALLLLASLAGGGVGQRLYSPVIDPDLGLEKLTVFGVRWLHYLWILPLIYLAFLASLAIVVYAAVVVFVADWSFVWHPSLWLNPVWGFCFPLGAFLVYVAGVITATAFIRFFEVMRYGQIRFKGWNRIGRVFLYGVGAPALSYTVAAIGADVAHAMPKPVEGDWKISVAIAVLISVVSIASSIHHWVKKASKFATKPLRH